MLIHQMNGKSVRRLVGKKPSGLVRSVALIFSPTPIFSMPTINEWGIKFNDPEDLIALCIGCHAKQRGGGHRMLKYYPDYQEFMSKYGEEWRAYYHPF